MAFIHSIDHPGVDGVRVGQKSLTGKWTINSTCIVYRLGDTVVDTGTAKQWKYVRDYLQHHSIKNALVTHYHEDHSGNCGHFTQHFGAKIQCHPISTQKLQQGFPVSLIRRLLNGEMVASETIPFADSISCGNGSELTPLHLPGHTDDMTCFIEKNKGWLFSGDLYVASQTRYLYREENISQILNSLQIAIDQDFDELFCAHRGYIQEGKQALIRKRDFIIDFREQVHDLHQRGLNEKVITRKLLGREDGMAFVTQNDMSKGNFVRACLESLPV